MNRSHLSTLLVSVCLAIVGCGDDAAAPTAPGQSVDELPSVVEGDATADPGTNNGKTDPGPPVDTGPVEPRTSDFGQACEEPDDCESGFCIEGATGEVCTESCVENCPTGWGCEQVFGQGSDVKFLCVPRFIRLCRPCTQTSDCHVGYLENQTDACVSFGDAGSFCGGDCAEHACPDGYQCINTTLPNGVSTKQCVPADGAECTCPPEWGLLDLSTDCAHTNEHGSCSGNRGCGADGLSACDGATPAAELCDGEDNDCNGKTDDIGDLDCEISNDFGTCTGKTSCQGSAAVCDATEPAAEVCNKKDDDCDGTIDEETCSDGIACTDDICVDDGACSNPISAGACLIEGTCYAAGDASPTDPCLQCLPDSSTSAWSNADGQACDDGEPCTKDDACTGGSCAGTSYVCDDGLDCTADMCTGDGACAYLPAPGVCAIGTDCWSDGDKNPDNQCLACSVDANPTAWTSTDGAACDDGDACTQADVCDVDTCGGAAYTCDDGSICTADECDGDGGCLFPAAAEGAGCDDAEGCTQGDVCTGGVCTGTVYLCDDGQGCTQDICDGKGGCSFEPISEGDACEDGDKCTLGEVCTGGVCAGGAPTDCAGLDDPCNSGVCNQENGECVANPTPGACDDSDPCTEIDQCAEGVCVGTPIDCSSLSGQCATGVCKGGSCTKELVAGACDDGNACTTDDVCAGDACTGKPVDCSYLDDQCNVGVCQAGGCVAQPKEAPCNDGKSCTVNDTCQAGVCQGQAKDCSVFDGACTKGVCNGGACQQQNKSGLCNDGDPCTDGDVCTGGVCAGSPKDCGFLTDTCNVGICSGGSCTKLPQPNVCNDNDSCTTNDFCQAGVCKGQPIECGYLDDQCNAGVCQFGSCVKSPKSGGCNDGDACSTGDQCIGGACVGTPKDCSYLNDQCNSGLCSFGTCQKKQKTGSCSDGNSCTTGDTCLGGSCVGSTKNCSYLSDQCNTGVCSSGSCIKSPKGGSCSDGNSCTTGDQCVGGTCIGSPKNCSYLNTACKTGVCSSGSCKTQNKSGSCNDNNSCTTSDSCQSGICKGNDPPDDAPNTYIGKNISATSGCDGLDYSLSGKLYPNSDVDWYWFTTTDPNTCDAQPKVQLVVPSGANFQLCAYFECKNGESVDLDCDEGTKVSGPKSGTSGCCSTKSGAQTESVRMSPSCGGAFSDDAGYVDVKVYVGPGSSQTCSGYTLKWGDS